MDAAAARAWLDAEIDAARRALAASPGNAACQGRLGRLQRHTLRLEEIGDAYVATIAEAAGEVVAPPAELDVALAPKKARK